MKKSYKIYLLFFIVNCTLLTANCYSQWTQLPNLPITGTVYDMYFVNANTGWMTFNTTGTILKTTNGGQNWIQQTTPASEVYDIQFFNDTLGVALSYMATNRLILKTTNGGTNWTQIYSTGFAWFNMQFVNKDTGWVCGTDGFQGGVWQTTDGGSNFQRQLTSSTGSLSKLFFLKEKGPSGYIGWAAQPPRVYRTTNSGVNWTQVYSSFGNFCDMSTISDLYFKDSLNGIMTRGGDCFNITTNGGYNWILINQFNATGGKVAAVNSTAWITLAEDSVIKTTNFFQSYGKQPIPVIAIKPIFAIDTNIVYGGLNNTIMLKTTNGGGNISAIEQISTDVPENFYLYQNYPNPFNPETIIKYQIIKSSNVLIKINDILSREVITLVDQKQSAGSYLVDFSGNGYSSGIYFYSLIIDGNIIDTKKMLMIK